MANPYLVGAGSTSNRNIFCFCALVILFRDRASYQDIPLIEYVGTLDIDFLKWKRMTPLALFGEFVNHISPKVLNALG